jgi:hypothetical protein
MRTIASLFLLLTCALQAAPQADPLWQKAVEMARRNKPWVPGITVLRVEVLDDKGKSTDTYESRLRFSPDGGGAAVFTVESAMRNGVDVTTKEREAQEKRNRDTAKNGKPSSLDLGDNPFDPDIQAALLVTALEGSSDVDGKTCVLYSFVLKKKDGGNAVGTAALEQESGAPVEVKYTLKPLPAGVQSLTTVLRYGMGPAGEGFLRDVAVEGTGGILFIKRAFRSDIGLDGYWKREEP